MGSNSHPSPAAFQTVWIASCFAYLGTWIARFVLPVATARLTESPAMVAAVVLALTAPWLLVGLQAGALVDRLDRRKVLLAVNATYAATAAVLAVLEIAGLLSVAALAGAAFVLGTATVFADTGIVAIVPMVVDSEHLERANTRLVGIQTAIEIIALPLGGALTLIGVELALLVSAGAALAGTVTMTTLGGSYRLAQPERTAMSRQIAEGLRFLWNNHSLRAISIMAAVINGCWSAWAAVFVLFALTPGPLGLNEFSYGVLLTVGSIGGGIGTLLTARVQRRFGRRSLIGINIGVNALLFAAPLVTASVWLIGAALLIGDMGGPMWGIAVLSMQQRIVPDAMRGRVSAGYRFISFGALSLGALAGGLIGETLGITWVFAGVAILTALMFIPFLRAVTEVSMTGSQTAITEATTDG